LAVARLLAVLTSRSAAIIALPAEQAACSIGVPAPDRSAGRASGGRGAAAYRAELTPIDRRVVDAGIVEPVPAHGDAQHRPLRMAVAQ